MRRIYIVVVVVILILSGCKKETKQHAELETLENVTSETAKTQHTSNKIYVYVCGAVVKEGVYELPMGSRIYEAIQMAGGFSETAALEQVNQAEILEDEMQIYVPTIDEAVAMQEEEDGKINLNTASKEDLMKLPGVGEAKALSIIQYREEHGKFQTIEEIMNISGIKQGLFDKIKYDIKI